VPAYGGAAGSASAEWYWYYYNNADDPQLQADYRQFQSKYYGSNFQCVPRACRRQLCCSD
jgi:hypothetical protein